MAVAHQYKNNAVDIFLLDAVAEAESDWLIIKRAWLPMIVWDRVSVVLRVMQGLTLLERFTLKCLLSLGECRSEDLWEIASLPPELTTWLFSILEQKGLASHDQYGVFRPNREASMKALEIRGVPVDRKDTRTVLWFPESEEIVVLKDATSLLTQLRHVLPGRQYPLAQHQKTSRGELINKAIQAGACMGTKLVLFHSPWMTLCRTGTCAQPMHAAQCYHLIRVNVPNWWLRATDAANGNRARNRSTRTGLAVKSSNAAFPAKSCQKWGDCGRKDYCMFARV